MTSNPIDQLVCMLDAELARDPIGRGVAALLESYSRTEEDWCEFLRYETTHYTRTLLHGCERYELLLLCWSADQASPIHDHQGQRCWMSILEGELQEQHFSEPNGRGPGPLERRDVRVFRPGGVAFITDDIALHEVRPLHGRPGVSLHLYSQPIPSCQIYCPETGTVSRRVLEFDAVRDTSHAG